MTSFISQLDSLSLPSWTEMTESCHTHRVCLDCRHPGSGSLRAWQALYLRRSAQPGFVFSVSLGITLHFRESESAEPLFCILLFSWVDSGPWSALGCARFVLGFLAIELQDF